ncbi:GNAT family N-acetyltransferase, partial [Citrobacter sp. TBCS-11]
DDRGYIDLFYISADYQRQGVGQQLLKDLEKSSQALMFSVNSSITAKAFFEKMGYQELKQNLVYLRGQEFINYTLLKKAK